MFVFVERVCECRLHDCHKGRVKRVREVTEGKRKIKTSKYTIDATLDLKLLIKVTTFTVTEAIYNVFGNEHYDDDDDKKFT